MRVTPVLKRCGLAAEGVPTGTAAACVRVVDLEALLLDGVGVADSGTGKQRNAGAVHDQRHGASALDGLVDGKIAIEAALVEEELVLHARTATRLHRDPQPQIGTTLGIEQLANLE